MKFFTDKQTTLRNGEPKAYTLVRFPTFADFLAACSAPNPENPSLQTSAASSWNGNVGYQKALEMLALGWPECSERIRSMAHRVKNAIPDTLLDAFRPQLTFDVTGLSLDVARFLDGEPECFADEIIPDKGDRMAGTGIVRISFSLAAMGDISAKEMERRGTFAVVIADILESLGYRVEIVGYISSNITHRKANGKVSYGQQLIVWPIKATDEMIDMDRLAFLMAHPSAFRTIGFNAMNVVGCAGSSYGSAWNLPKEFEGDITIPELSQADGSDLATAKKILAGLKKIGIDIDPDSLNAI